MNIIFILEFCLIMSNNFKNTGFDNLKTRGSSLLINTHAANWPVENAGYTGPPKAELLFVYTYSI